MKPDSKAIATRTQKRFLGKVIKSAGCWLWSAAINRKGYGHFRVEGTSINAHRFSFLLHNGPIPEGHYVYHTCGARACCNPQHLKITTRDRTDEKTATYFWNKIIKSEGCWQWSGDKSPDGYGRFWDGQKKIGAHVFSCRLHGKTIVAGQHVDHLCRNPECCNPEHLEVVSARENVLRGVGPSANNAKKTHCVHGHALTPENLKIDKKNRRNCRICLKAKQDRSNSKIAKKNREEKEAAGVHCRVRGAFPYRCKYGHLVDEKNVVYQTLKKKKEYISRSCRQCALDSCRRSYARRRPKKPSEN